MNLKWSQTIIQRRSTVTERNERMKKGTNCMVDRWMYYVFCPVDDGDDDDVIDVYVEACKLVSFNLIRSG